MQVKKEKSKHDRLNSTLKRIRFEDELLEQVEERAKRENESFSGWVKGACREKLARDIKK